MSQTQLAQDLLVLARAAATAAADLVMAGRPKVIAGKATVSTKSSVTDPVTEMDRAAEHLIVSLIKGQRPLDGFIGEEGSSTESESGITWAIDPIDGTVNYMYGLPAWSVSVAALENGIAIAGCLVAPDLNKVYFATKGGGGWEEQAGLATELKVLPSDDLARTLLATGFSYRKERRSELAPIFAQVLPQVRDVRRMGSASIDIASVATGGVDAYVESGVRIWDYAAALLIATEAGAEFIHRDQPWGEWLLVARPGLAELLEPITNKL
jgi:myo-inositol-1(or 4)-monophosphatase